MSSLNKESAVQMMKAVYKEVPVQSLSQEDRRSFYNMVASLLSTRLEGEAKIKDLSLFNFRERV